MSRKNAREITFKAIYANIMGGSYSYKEIDEEIEFDFNEEDVVYFEDCYNGYLREQGTIDALIDNYLVDWKLERIAKVERSIMALGAYELLFREDIPIAVTINESVEIAKKFTREEGAALVNGVLGNINRDKEAGKSLEEIIKTDEEVQRIDEFGDLE